MATAAYPSLGDLAVSCEFTIKNGAKVTTWHTRVTVHDDLRSRSSLREVKEKGIHADGLEDLEYETGLQEELIWRQYHEGLWGQNKRNMRPGVTGTQPSSIAVPFAFVVQKVS
jgi:hypothetical protein